MRKTREYRTAVLFASIVLLACLASSCGQKGGLTRPELPAASIL